jgi:hypothetical protein
MCLLQISDNTNEIVFYATVVKNDFQDILCNWIIYEDMRTIMYPENKNGIVAREGDISLKYQPLGE